MPTKIIAVVGLTGNQGSSVAKTFLQEPGWKIRGITRDPSKASAQEWASRGVEVVQADLEDPSSLNRAFEGAHAIFGVTDFGGLMQSTETLKAAEEQSLAVNAMAMKREIQQGKNIVDAAATILTLERFILSTLSYARKWSGGKIAHNLHFDGKAQFTEYARTTYPELWAKTSLLQMGMFASNLKIGVPAIQKIGDKDYKLLVPMGDDRKFPMIDTNTDTGTLTRALLYAPPGQNLVGAGSYLSWTEWCEIFGRATGVRITFERQDRRVLEEAMGPFGEEIADMFQYIDEYGYDGGDPSALYPWDLKQYGVDVKVTTAEEYVQAQDWSGVLKD